MPTFNPSIDTYLREGSPTTNYGSVALEAGSRRSKTTTENEHALLRFDLSAYAGQTVTAATLWIRVTSISWAGRPDRVMALHRITQPGWTEGGATWNTYDGTNNWVTAGGDYAAAPKHNFDGPRSAVGFTIPSGPAFVSLVQDALDNRSGILDLLIKEEDESTNDTFLMVFMSREYGANQPVLTVTFALRRRIFVIS